MQDTWLLALAIRNGQPPVADDALYRRCFDMIRQVQDKLTAAGASDNLCEEIKFAHCVFPDEALMTQPDTDVSVWWRRTLLQGHFPGHLNGGEHFFEHINKLWRDSAPSGVPVACYFRMLSFVYTAYVITFTVVPWSIHDTWRPEERSWPAISGTFPARISSPEDNDLYSHIDAQGRYRRERRVSDADHA